MASRMERGDRAGVLGVVRRGWLTLIAAVGLSYLLMMAGVLVAANVARGLATLEVNLFQGPHGVLPVWTGILSYLQGVALVVTAVVLAFSALLAATVEVTRSVRNGERVAPWTPFHRGLSRILPVTAGLVVLVPRLVLLGLATGILIVASVITVPVAALTGVAWLVRPSWRKRWMRGPLLLAVPFGILFLNMVRWALWLPFVVVGGTGGRSGLRASRDAVRPQWAKTARPLAGLGAVVSVAVAGLIAMSSTGVGPVVAGLTTVAVGVMAVMAFAITATLLYERHTGSMPPPGPGPGVRFPLLPRWAPSPGLMVALAVCLCAQTLWVTERVASAAPAAPAVLATTYVVNTLDDNLTPDPLVQCVAPAAPCMLRAAVARAKTSGIASPSIGFALNGTIDLLGPLVLCSAVTLDGGGAHISLRNPTGTSTVGSSTVVVGGSGCAGGSGGEGSPPPSGEAPPPGPIALRNLTIAGVPTNNAPGLSVSGGTVTVENSTFTDHHYNDMGAAIFSAGTLSVLNSTFVENAAGPNLGTIWSYGYGPLSVVNSTFVDNHGGGVAGGAGLNATIRNSLFRDGDGGFNCPSGAGIVTSGNVANDGSCADPPRPAVDSNLFFLGSLGDYGGSVATVPIRPGSPAIAAGDPGYCPASDARGELRPIPPTPCDTGAYQSATGTTTTVAAAQNPAPFGSAVLVTVTVAHPQAAPSGSVRLDGLPGGSQTTAIDPYLLHAVFSVDGLTVGAHTLTATYIPDGPLAASTGTLVLTIAQQISATRLTVDPPGGTSPVGAPVILTAVVTNAAEASGAVPTGTVTFLSDGTSVGTATLAAGTATRAGVVLGGGLHSLTATYGGSDGFEGSTSTPVAHAAQSTSLMTLTDQPAAVSTYGQPLTLSASVVAPGPAVPGAPLATGFVTFNANQFGGLAFGALGATGVASGTTTTALPVGVYQLQASYPGDNLYAAGLSNIVTHTVQAAVTATTLTGPSGSTVFGQPAAFTATVSAAGTPAVPVGTVSFQVDGVEVGIVTLVGGHATYSPTVLTVTGGTPHQIVAVYQPLDGSFLASQSTAASHTVAKGGTEAVLDAPPASVTGEAVDLVAAVSALAPSVAVPTGTVTFSSGGTDLGTAALINGRATLVVTTLALGAHVLTARFSGDAGLLASTAAAVDHVVSKAVTNVGLGASPTAPVHAQPVTLTATAAAAAPGSGTPTGQIEFRDGATVLGVAPLVAGIAVLAVGPLGAGDRALTAAYAGDAGYLAGLGALTLTVAKAVPVVAIAGVSPSPSRFGSPVTIRATVVSPTGSTPTGDVEFSFGGSGNNIGRAPVVAGVATFTTSDLNIARTIIGAHYLGDANHADAYPPQRSDADLIWHTVLPAQYTIGITTAPVVTKYGEQIHIVADMGGPIGGHIPTGLVRIRVVNHNDQKVTTFDPATGRATWDADGAGIQPGDLRIVATADADFFFEAATGEFDGHHVDQAPATIALTTTPAEPVSGSPTTLTATLAPALTALTGRVTFYDNGLWAGEGDVDATGKASASVTFPVKGPHTLTATYNGGPGFFVPVTSDPLAVTVHGRPLPFATTFTSFAGFGEDAKVDSILYTFDTTPPSPTGTVSVTLGDKTIGVAPVPVSSGSILGLLALRTFVNVGSSLGVGRYDIVIHYSGDSTWEATSVASVLEIGPRAVQVVLNTWPGNATAGEPVRLGGGIIVPSGMVVPPTGTLTFRGGGQSCDVALTGGITGGSCTVTFDHSSPDGDQMYAIYSGDANYRDSHSDPVLLKILPNRASVDLVPSYREIFGGPAWTDTDPVSVKWTVNGTGTAAPVGPVEIWTNEGQQYCPSTLTGSCDVRFKSAADEGSVEVRYLGGRGFEPASAKATAPVRACFSVLILAPGKTTTAPNCGGARYAQNTALIMEATPPAGYQLAGWSFGPDTGPLLGGFVPVTQNRVVEPRWNPICFTLKIVLQPPNLARTTPTPAPNCDDRQGSDFSVRNLDAIRTAEVMAGNMRYRVGTKVTLPKDNYYLKITAIGEIAPLGWTGYGFGIGAGGVVTMDADREVKGQLLLPCQKIVVDGPPGALVGVVSSTLDVSKAPLLANAGKGVCGLPDGTMGYLTGTTVKVAMTPAAGTWFTGWTALSPLAGHRAPAGPTAAIERPADYVAGGGAAVTTIVVPSGGAALSGTAATVNCFELKITLKDGVAANRLLPGAAAPSVTTTPAPNCPAWWLADHYIWAPQAVRGEPAPPPLRWYMGGTEVQVAADIGYRRGYVDEFADPKSIEFRRWTGGISGDARQQKVTITNTVATTAEWYVPAQCSKIFVRALPATAGETLVSDFGTACPTFQSQYAPSAPPTPEAKLGTTMSLVGRPNGSLQTIWQVEGTSVSNTEDCRTRELLIDERRAQLGAQNPPIYGTAADDVLKSAGYFPGWNLVQIQQAATEMYGKGYSQANIISDLKSMHLLDDNGQPFPDRLQKNPCDKISRDTVLPAGQRIVSMDADGDVTATAWFCQAIEPSVTVIDTDGGTHAITGSGFAAFNPLFKSATGNCPTPGWFLPGSTATFGAPGSTVAGYKIEGWKVDGVAAPAGALSLPMRAEDPVRKVALTVRVQCNKLTASAPFGVTIDPQPNCPFAPASSNLYIQGTKVTVTAGDNSNSVWQGWKETGSMFNPALGDMTLAVTLTGQFRAKDIGEQIQSTVIDPAINALGVAAKKVVGGVAFTIKVIGQDLIEDGLLSGLSAIGTGLKLGFNALGVDGKVLDGIVLGLQTPANAFGASMAGFDCVEEWAWGHSVPTLSEIKDMAISAASSTARDQLAGVNGDELAAQAKALAVKLASGDPATVAAATLAVAGLPQASAVLALAQDINANPDVWAARAKDVGNYALSRAAEELGKPFTWETSASDAWTSGGDAFLKCMAKNGKAMAGQ